jgi:hypothetical protein
MSPHHRQSEHLPPQHLWAISIKERTRAKVSSPLEWLLLTTIPVTSIEQARQCIRWYQMRWLIERYHYVLKSGCHIEELQLEEAERIEKALAVYTVVAWRLLFLTYKARVHPEESCEPILEEQEWQAMSCFLEKTTTPPTKPPTIHQAVRMLARLGGFLGRTHDENPGVKVIWRGLRRLDDITQAYCIFKTCG